MLLKRLLLVVRFAIFFFKFLICYLVVVVVFLPLNTQLLLYRRQGFRDEIILPSLSIRLNESLQMTGLAALEGRPVVHSRNDSGAGGGLRAVSAVASVSRATRWIEVLHRPSFAAFARFSARICGEQWLGYEISDSNESRWSGGWTRDLPE